MGQSNAAGLDLAGRFARHPYQALLVAAGVGYVLAGGLFTRLTFNVLRVGIRMGALPIVQRKLLAAVISAPTSQTSPSSLDDDPNHERRTT